MRAPAAPGRTLHPQHRAGVFKGRKGCLSQTRSACGCPPSDWTTWNKTQALSTTRASVSKIAFASAAELNGVRNTRACEG